MAYVALYRKYRSQTFDELMGQDAVTTTLRNAIASKRFGHAYLFYGARGCGKTSTARLLARALNCEQGPTPNPCGTCRFCVSIREGSCLDVVEMDAASETGIDDVREKVIENVQYAPTEARYKVYIIDEVHDLSQKAFDALLKTIEEPPQHVVFILATTEFHKVPITIRSRCQCFQFRRGSIQDLCRAIQRVAEAEGYTIESAALLQIARAAEGSWRDALSLLEQVMAFSDGKITAQTVQSAIGVLGTQELLRVTQTLVSDDLGAVFRLAAELLEGGADARQLLSSLQGHLRDLALLAAGAHQTALLEMGAERVEMLKPQAQHFSPQTLLEMMHLLAQAEQEVRFSNHHRWIVERTLAQLHNLAQQKSEAPTTPVASPIADLSPTPLSPEAAPLSATATPVPKPKPQLSSQNEPTAPQPPQTPAVERDPRFAAEITLEVLRRAWPTVLERVGKVSPSGRSFLERAEVADLEGNQVIVTFQDGFSRDRIQTKGRELLIKKLNEVLRTSHLTVQCVLREEIAPPQAYPFSQHPPSLPLSTAQAPTEHPQEETSLLTSSPSATTSANGAKEEGEFPFLAEVLDIFGGEEVKSEDIKPPNGQR